MKGILKKLYKKSFVRNVAIVATGTAAAQAVTMAFTPIITRLYGPEAIGVLGVFMAMVLVVSPIAALNYPYGIVLPKSVSDAKGLIRLSLYISLGLAIISAIILALFNKSIVSLFQLEGIEPFLYLIPLIILFSGFLQVTRQWLFRTKQFRITAKVEFLKALVLNSSKVGIGWFYPVAAVLVILTTLGIAFQALLLLVGIKRSNLKHESKDNEESLKLKELAKKYRDFPLFRTPQAFIHSISNNLPVFILASFFGPAAAGFYTLGNTVLGIPTQLIGKSVADVFYPRIAEASNNGENLTKLILKATTALAVVGIVPFGMIVSFGPWLFSFVFGEEWIVAGEYARWLALWSFIAFITRPITKVVLVLNLQAQQLFYEIIIVFVRAVVLFIGFYYYNSDIYAILFFSLATSGLKMLFFLYVLKKSRKFT